MHLHYFITAWPRPDYYAAQLPEEKCCAFQFAIIFTSDWITWFFLPRKISYYTDLVTVYTVLGVSVARCSTPWGAVRTCLSLALFKTNSGPVFNLSGGAPRNLLLYVACSRLCEDRRLTLINGKTKSRPVSSLTTRTGVGRTGRKLRKDRHGGCLLYVGY